MGKLVAVLIGLLIAGGGGYYAGSQQTADLNRSLDQVKQELTETQSRERLAKMTTQAGTVLVEVQQKNFASAQEHSTKFFDAVREAEAAAMAGSNVKQTMMEVLSQRDAVTSDLAMGSSNAAPKLTAIFLAMQQLVQ